MQPDWFRPQVLQISGPPSWGATVLHALDVYQLQNAGLGKKILDRDLQVKVKNTKQDVNINNNKILIKTRFR